MGNKKRAVATPVPTAYPINPYFTPSIHLVPTVMYRSPGRIDQQGQASDMDRLGHLPPVRIPASAHPGASGQLGPRWAQVPPTCLPRCHPPPVSFGASISSELATEAPVEHRHRSVSNREENRKSKSFCQILLYSFPQTPSASSCPAISRRPLVGTNYIFFCWIYFMKY